MKDTALIFFSRSSWTEPGHKSFGLRSRIAGKRLVSRLTESVLHETDFLSCDKFWVSDVPIPLSILHKHRFSENLIQIGNCLQERLKNAFVQLFERGYRLVIVIGNDTLISGAELHRVVAHQGDVYGPSADGGFYLLKLQVDSKNRYMLNADAWAGDQLKCIPSSVHVLKIRVDLDSWTEMNRTDFDRRLINWIRSLIAPQAETLDCVQIMHWYIDFRRFFQKPPPILIAA